MLYIRMNQKHYVKPFIFKMCEFYMMWLRAFVCLHSVWCTCSYFLGACFLFYWIGLIWRARTHTRTHTIQGLMTLCAMSYGIFCHEQLIRFPLRNTDFPTLEKQWICFHQVNMLLYDYICGCGGKWETLVCICLFLVMVCLRMDFISPD